MAPDLDIHQPAGKTIRSLAIGPFLKAASGLTAAPVAGNLRRRFTGGG